MNPLFFNSSHPGPAVHALVIGVGGYPYLPGGPNADPRADLTFPDMRQLTSPPRSALAFARHLTEGGVGGWRVPPASVDLLISCKQGDSLPDLCGPMPRAATIDNIRDAFEAWSARCSAHPDNIAVLYFCGHGVQGDHQLLLASDFNRYGDTPFAQAFDFERTRLALQQRAPRTQCFIIDACRMDYYGVAPAEALPLARPEPLSPGICQTELTLRMPAYDEALGRRENVSYLTQALLRALDGQAATMDEEGAWVVRLAGIRQAIDLLLMEELGVSSLARGVEADTLGDTVLLRLNGAPLARLTVSCHPAEAASRTTLTCTPYYPPDLPGVDCGKARQTREENGSPAAREWRMQLRAGVYTLSAKSATTEISRPHHVCPPHSRARFEVAP